MGRLERKVAIITGAGSGLGRATMLLFAREGAKVIGVGRRREMLEEVVEQVQQEGGDGAMVVADLSTDEGAERTVREAIASSGGVDILVNNAGVGYSYRATQPDSMNTVEETTPDMWNHVMAINLGSAFLMTRRIIPEMRRRGGGSIVNVSSISGYRGQETAHTYTAAKGGLLNLTRSLALTYAIDGIRANSVAPGYMRTPMVEDLLGVFDDDSTRYGITPMGRPAEPEEIAYGCLFFASNESSYCNGALLVIDGGMSAKGA